MLKAILCASLLFSYTLASSQGLTIEQPHPGVIQVTPDKISWIDAPAPFLPGAKMAILEGNPKKEGVFTVRFKLPPNYLIPPHMHSKDERVTVISGAVYVGFGDINEEGKSTKFKTGSYYVNPSGLHHYVYTKDEEVILQITGMGPWNLTMVEDH